MENIANPKLSSIHQQLESAVDKLHEFTRVIEHKGLQQTVEDVQLQLGAPFMFVIVGEVKAGKSSFINALLDAGGKEIAKVAPMPMTDTIQQILYGEERVEEINPYLKKIYQPIDILKDICIVDTPGTNTIVDHHQEITERFIPHADLIVFVFESKNPYRQSAWEFFDYINEEWRRNIIFVLQQKDLMEPDDLVINIKGVRDHAVKKGIAEPLVYDVSAKQELNGDKVGSGFTPLKEYISKNITGGKAPSLKMLNKIETSKSINEKIDASLTLRKKQWEKDTVFRTDIKETLDIQEGKTKKQISTLLENLLASYDRITNKTASELEEGLSFTSVLKRSFSSVFGTNTNLKDCLASQTKDFEYELNTTLKDKLQSGIIDVADNIQMMGKLVDNRIKDSETVLRNNDEIFADIAERRANVLRDLQQSFSDFMKNSENFYDESLANEGGSVTPKLATGGGIAVVGIVLSAVLPGAVFDITGGILTAVGLGFAGITLGLNKGKILRQFKGEIEKGRETLEKEITAKLNDYTERIKRRIDDNFFELDRLLDHEEKTLNKLEGLRDEITKSLSSAKVEVESMIN